MSELEKVIMGLECCRMNGKGCRQCPYNKECDVMPDFGNAQLCSDALELLKQPVDKELHLDDLDALVNMIAIKAKAEGRFFSPYEVGLALVQRGQHDERFKWGEVIKYSPSEVEQILNEVSQDDRS